jgi:hypothetical protein
VEIDMLARYGARLAEAAKPAGGAKRKRRKA